MNQEFDEIRPYYDEELPAVYEELIADPAFRQVAGAAMPDLPFDRLAALMRSCKTKQDFQVNICYNILKRIIREATQGVTFDNSAQPDRGSAYTYVSNHRDIVLDSGFLSLMLVEQGQDTVEIAIGDNLLIYPWIKKLVRINKSFIVQRALTMRQMLEASARMSRYMHHTIRDKHQSIWIAQREGRAKDSSDRTQESILKMMAMAGEGDIISRLKEMNIVPLAISYEYDPCDYLKAKEFQQKRDNPDYKKTLWTARCPNRNSFFVPPGWWIAASSPTTASIPTTTWPPTCWTGATASPRTTPWKTSNASRTTCPASCRALTCLARMRPSCARSCC